MSECISFSWFTWKRFLIHYILLLKICDLKVQELIHFPTFPDGFCGVSDSQPMWWCFDGRGLALYIDIDTIEWGSPFMVIIFLVSLRCLDFERIALYHQTRKSISMYHRYGRYCSSHPVEMGFWDLSVFSIAWSCFSRSWPDPNEAGLTHFYGEASSECHRMAWTFDNLTHFDCPYAWLQYGEMA